MGTSQGEKVSNYKILKNIKGKSVQDTKETFNYLGLARFTLAKNDLLQKQPGEKGPNGWGLSTATTMSGSSGGATAHASPRDGAK